MHWFTDLTDAKKKLQAWQREYNESRPHRALNELSPLEYKARWADQRSETHWRAGSENGGLSKGQELTDVLDQKTGGRHEHGLSLYK